MSGGTRSLGGTVKGWLRLLQTGLKEPQTLNTVCGFPALWRMEDYYSEQGCKS